MSLKPKPAETLGLWFPSLPGYNCEGFTGGLDCKETACNAGDPGSIPGFGRSPGGGHGNPFQYSCLGNPMDKRAWRARVHGGRKESDMT